MDKAIIDEMKEKFRTKDFEYYKKEWGMSKEEFERYVNFEMTLEEIRQIMDRKEN